MIVEMLAQVEVPAPPSGKVVYPLGARVNVPDELALEWLEAEPPKACDPDAPKPEEA